MSIKTSFKDGVLTVSHFYQAAREDVFDAWIETSKVKQWWGCADCTNVRSEIEPEVGGKYNHHMTIHGHESPGFATLIEYDPPTRLAYVSALPHDPDAKMTVTVDFSEMDGGTLVQLRHAGIPDIKVEGGVDMPEIITAGWTAAFTKLDAFLEKS